MSRVDHQNSCLKVNQATNNSTWLFETLQLSIISTRYPICKAQIKFLLKITLYSSTFSKKDLGKLT